MLPEDKKGPTYYRRPYGVGGKLFKSAMDGIVSDAMCSVYNLKEVFRKLHNSTDVDDISMPIL